MNRSVKPPPARDWPFTITLAVLLLLALGAALAHAEINQTFPGGTVTYSGYVDTYYVDDFADTAYPDRQITPSGISPVYSHSRKDGLGVNHALLDGKFDAARFRGALGIQAGTYVQKNYASEDEAASHLYEAQLGYELSTSSPVWIDAGIFPSHIGLESAISKDNLTLTRSIMADNTPYYEAGAKITWELNKQWSDCLCLLQGWQQIGSKNPNKALGTQVQFKPTDALVFNSSTYLGQSPNSPGGRLRRYFHDFYVTWQVSKPWSLAFATDVGADERSTQDRSLVGWLSATAIARWQFLPQWAVAGRVEHYRDPHGLTVATGTPGNFVATGGSVNLDYQPNPHVLLRVEWRTVGAQHPVFVERTGLNAANQFVTASTTLAF